MDLLFYARDKEIQKDDIVWTWGHCRKCDQIGNLFSYDASVLTHVLGITIAKGKEIHVTDLCCYCKKALRTTKNERHQLVSRELEPPIQKYLRQTDNAELAGKALHAAV